MELVLKSTRLYLPAEAGPLLEAAGWRKGRSDQRFPQEPDIQHNRAGAFLVPGSRNLAAAAAGHTASDEDVRTERAGSCAVGIQAFEVQKTPAVHKVAGNL